MSFRSAHKVHHFCLGEDVETDKNGKERERENILYQLLKCFSFCHVYIIFFGHGIGPRLALLGGVFFWLVVLVVNNEMVFGYKRLHKSKIIMQLNSSKKPKSLSLLNVKILRESLRTSSLVDRSCRGGVAGDA